VGYLDPQESVIGWFVLLAGFAAICLLLWLLNKLLRKLGVREHPTDRIGSSMLEIERLVRPRAEHVRTARRQRKAALHNAKGHPPAWVPAPRRCRCGLRGWVRAR